MTRFRIVNKYCIFTNSTRRPIFVLRLFCPFWNWPKANFFPKFQSLSFEKYFTGSSSGPLAPQPSAASPHSIPLIRIVRGSPSPKSNVYIELDRSQGPTKTNSSHNIRLGLTDPDVNDCSNIRVISFNLSRNA